MTAGESVVYVLPDKMGGMMNIVANLLAWRRHDDLAYHVVLTHNHCGPADTRSGVRLEADTQSLVEFSLPIENVHAVLHRLAAAVPAGEGVIVANDLLELAMLHVHDRGRAAVQILHGDDDYYYDLAVRHESVIDVFAVYSLAMYDTLKRRLPARSDAIRYLPYGVRIPDAARTPADGPLRLLYAGRLEHGQKGVFDLPAVDAVLRDRGVPVSWTIAGDGPDGAALRARWGSPQVRWLGTLSNADVIALGTSHDVFVLPTRYEGFPVALVEAMASGLVPVVNDIPSGVPEIVETGVSGFRPAVGDIGAFADAIATLAGDRTRLESMSRAARARVIGEFDIRARVAAYQELYANWRAWKRPAPDRTPLPYGSRLDRAWLPNAVVRTIRRALRARRHRTGGGAR